MNRTTSDARIDRILRAVATAHAEDMAEAALPVFEFADRVAAPMPPRLGPVGVFGSRGWLPIAALLLLAAALLIGGVAVASGLIRLPGQTRTPLDLAAVNPCDVVGWRPTIDHWPYQDAWVLGPGESEHNPLSNVIGPACFSYEQAGHRTFYWRVTPTDQPGATAIVDRIFEGLFQPTPEPEEFDGSQLWVGPIPTSHSVSTMGVAVLSEPYFFVLELRKWDPWSTSVNLPREIVWWWAGYLPPAPDIEAQVADILARLREMEETAANAER